MRNSCHLNKFDLDDKKNIISNEVIDRFSQQFDYRFVASKFTGITSNSSWLTANAGDYMRQFCPGFDSEEKDEYKS